MNKEKYIKKFPLTEQQYQKIIKEDKRELILYKDTDLKIDIKYMYKSKSKNFIFYIVHKDQNVKVEVK